MTYYTDIDYNVKPILLPDGSTAWGAYENDNIVAIRPTKQEAQQYIDTYRRLMR